MWLCVCAAGVYILIGAGALMMVVGFLGCCGAIQESPFMLGLVSRTTYGASMLVFGNAKLVLRLQTNNIVC